MMSCEFCKDGKVAESEYKGDGILPGGVMLRALCGQSSERCGVRLEGRILYYDNSDGEYAEQGVKINYCPICGERMDEKA